MFPGNKEALVATGYLRAGQEHLVAGNIDPEMSREEVLTEIAASVGQTFLGLTVNCARCHNHKFDPISQKDYYKMQASLFGYVETDFPLTSREEADVYRRKVADVDARIAALRSPNH